MIANLAKGGVLKVFDRIDGKLLLNDCGLLGQLDNGQVVTTQWIDPDYQCEADVQGWQVSGNMHTVPSNRLFTPVKLILFRIALVFLAWNPALAHFIKGRIRQALVLGNRTVPVRFRRCLTVEVNEIIL